MSGRMWPAGSGCLSNSATRAFCGLLCYVCLAASAPAQERREREPNSAYAERRAKLAAQVDGPIILWGFTGREEVSEAYIFEQEENFYYLTGHNEEGAGLLILPPPRGGAPVNGPREILFLPAKNPEKEKWNGFRMSPGDPGIEARTGFPAVKSFDSDFRSVVENLAKAFPAFYTILPYRKELGGYPHEKAVVEWLQLAAPQAKLKDIRAQIGAMRQIKSSGEIAFLKEAIDLSVDSHLEAMKLMHPGLYEYQVAAKMVEVQAWGGSEAEAYAPIVGSGLNSTVLHYDKLARKIEDGDIVVVDVGAQYSGYAADITRTIPANGKFTPRQREIYNIVLGAQNAALAALKPGMDFCSGGKSIHKIAYDYINTHGKDLHGKSLGPYFIHYLGHHIGLNVHDAGEFCAPFQPGMVVTMEPGIYIPEENLGVRIEDDVLITESGNKLLSERLPRDPDEIEKIMAAATQSAKAERVESRENNSPAETPADSSAVRSLIDKYAKSIDGADTALAAEVWLDSPDVSFIHPLGHEHGFEQIKQNVYQHLMGDTFSERKLSIHDVSVHVYGDAARAEFYWDFTAKFKKDGSPLTTHGRETQLYQKMQGRWRLVHVHYSGMPATVDRQGF
jgi:Xaa-Pro aminopeptidase